MGALSGVTSAVVGVILNLALVFAAAVIFPAGSVSNPDWFAVAMSLISFVALSCTGLAFGELVKSTYVHRTTTLSAEAKGCEQ